MEGRTNFFPLRFFVPPKMVGLGEESYPGHCHFLITIVVFV